MILPLVPFGNTEWWNLALRSNAIQLNLFENYQKQTWRNRYDLLGANGIQKLTIPVTKPSGIKIKTSEVLIYNEDNWQNIHWRSIKSAYGSSPFWIYYSDALEVIFSQKFNSLKEFCLASVEFIIEELQLDIELIEHTEIPNDLEIQYLNFKPSKSTFQANAYQQVFSDRFEFQNNLSVLDVLFNVGPESEYYINQGND